jgi:replicative DNA helicase Mcm
MDATELIEKFNEFLNLYYKEDILRIDASVGETLKIDFISLTKFDLDLSEYLLENPEECIKACELSLRQYDIKKKIHVRFFNFTKSSYVLIRNIRSKHINKLLVLEGLVRQKGDVRPLVTDAKFECPSCGNIITILQMDSKFREPEKCGCGRKGKFRLLNKTLIDAQRIVLEEIPEQLDSGEQPKRMSIILKNDLVSPLSEKKTNPGSSILVVGILKEIERIDKQGAKSTLYDLVVEGNYIEGSQKDFSQLQITEEEEEKIIEFSKDKELKYKLISSMVPTIQGHDKVKEALLLQILGGVTRDSKTGTKSRGNIHILLIGDPGAGKSQMLKRMTAVAPKAQFVSGKGTSGAGLTASVVKDEFMGGWALEAGALVLTNKGQVMIDELDKMSTDDASSMHEALEQQQITITKANIRATLVCETTVLAAANPKFGRFDPYESIAKQINLPSTLINRFDLIFPIRDLPNEINDKQISSHILKIRRDISVEAEAPVQTDFLRKYIGYAKQHMNPILDETSVKLIQDFYVGMRNPNNLNGERSPIPINARNLEALIRLSEAHAKMRLSNVVTKEDVYAAIELVKYCLNQVGIDPETGKIDVDRLETGITSSQRNKIILVRQVINELSELMGNMIPIEDVISKCKDLKIDEDVVEESIEKLNRSGDIYIPKKNFISKV